MYPSLENLHPAHDSYRPPGSSAPPQGGSGVYYPPIRKSTERQPPPSPQVVEGIPMVNQRNDTTATPPSQPSGYWSTGLCDCFDDVNSCKNHGCLACWCPCVAFGQLSEIVDKGNSSCCLNGSLYFGLCILGAFAVVLGVPLSCQWIYSCTYRGKIKHDLGLPQSCCEECCIHFWCEPCALCQEYREIQNQGYRLPLGWNGNMERFRQEDRNRMPATTMGVAPIAPSMSR